MEQNPFSILQGIAGGYILSRCLHVVADLGVADVLEETPLTAADIAPLVGANTEALSRVLRLLAAHGVFQSQEGKYLHSPLSRMLRTDHPHSVRATVRNLGETSNWAAYQELEYSVRTGLPAGDKIYPGGTWAYKADHPEANSIFNQAMEIKARGQVANIIAAYDFSGFDVIGDIGGGHGHLLRAVLERVPTAKGVLFEQPHVIKELEDLASQRLILKSGDFFKDDLPVCDVYLLMEVIHDWDDDQSVSILKAVQRVAPPHSKILLIERVIPEDPGPDWSKVLDIHMLTVFGGRQRTRQEYEALLDKAGLSIEREITTRSDVSILEAATKNNLQKTVHKKETYVATSVLH